MWRINSARMDAKAIHHPKKMLINNDGLRVASADTWDQNNIAGDSCKSLILLEFKYSAVRASRVVLTAQEKHGTYMACGSATRIKKTSGKGTGYPGSSWPVS